MKRRKVKTCRECGREYVSGLSHFMMYRCEGEDKQNGSS